MSILSYALIKAYCKKYPEEVNKVNERNWSPLSEAGIAARNVCYKSNIESVATLLENGVDTDIQSHSKNSALTLAIVNIKRHIKL